MLYCFWCMYGKNGYGSIINISSDLGLIAPDHRLYKNDKNGIQQYKPVSYSIIKHALIGSLNTYQHGMNRESEVIPCYLRHSR